MASAKESPCTLQAQLDEKKKAFMNMIPKEKQSALNESVVNTINGFNPSTALNVGDIAPDFELKDSTNTAVKLSDLLSEKKAVVLTWYRGGWCPYCNLTLRAFVKSVDEFNALNAGFVALSPELPDESLSTQEKINLKFNVLSDVGLKVADKYGVSFILHDQVTDLYKGFGIDLANMNGNQGNNAVKLPVPATFVIGEDRKVVYRFVDPDYTKRAEPDDVISAIKSMA